MVRSLLQKDFITSKFRLVETENRRTEKVGFGRETFEHLGYQVYYLSMYNEICIEITVL